jgi:hypothetical protein
MTHCVPQDAGDAGSGNDEDDYCYFQDRVLGEDSNPVMPRVELDRCLD